MANNPNGAAECSLEVFGSWVTETAPENLPAGVSPDCPDNVFAPGEVGTRPAFQKIFNPPLEPNATITYGKSFVAPNGQIKNLYLSSVGNFYVEDVVNAPGVATLLFTTTPGAYAKSVTAFGREWIAISDGLHGQDAPVQFDGANVDRVTQDGPGNAPTVTSVAFPPVALEVTGGATEYGVLTSTPGTRIFGLYRVLIVTFSSAPGYTLGQSVILAGSTSAPANGTFTVSAINSPTDIVFSGYDSTVGTVGTGGTAVAFPGAGVSLTRQNNTVSGQTAAPHNLQVGYQALIAGTTASELGGGIASVVINNEDNPGVATITTNTPHGLVPENDVFLNGIGPNVLAVASYSYNNFVADVTTSAPHGLAVGSSILLTLGAGGGAVPVVVTAVISPTEFTSACETAGSGSGSGGSVQYVFPLASTTVPNTDTFEVIEAPTPTTFTVQFTYTDGTWTGGTVSFAWDGTFYVTAVPSPTTFAYQQYGPNTSTGSAGTLTPFGQAAPGLHQLQYSFLTRQGALTRPSPPVTFEANGGQYLQVDDLAIGPPNIVARVLEVTGALGSKFFYIPVPAQVNGLVVSTSTVVNDNVSTSVLLDFSDQTLYAALGTSIPGNNLAAQNVLDGALDFLFSSTRLGTFGQRNRLQNLLNMGFDGGYLATAPTLPTGWTSSAAGGTLTAGRFNGFGWAINTAAGPGTLSQSFYQDCYGAPIATAATLYKVRYYLSAAGTVQLTLSSASTGFSTVATIVATGAGWWEATFAAATPAAIPEDLMYSLAGLAGNFVLDEGSAIYAQTPYLDTLLFDSYVNNPEGFDGLTGKYGPTQDTRKVMAAGIVRGNLHLLTQEPSGRLHEVIDNGTTEPAGWDVNELEANCGILSAFALTVSQADDSSSSGGEEWMAWASESGARIFGGGDQWKISQEIQPNWYDPGSTNASQINMAAALTTWALNDPVARVIYFGVPLGTATAPSQVYPMNYRELDDAYTIAHSPPFHPSLAGKLVATDNTRKWCYWPRSFNGAARMYRPGADGGVELLPCFFAGNKITPGTGGFGNVYTLNPAMSTDDDYGAIGSYYVTCALPTHDQEQALQLGSGRKLLAYMSSSFTCVGNVLFTIYRNGLQYPYPITFTRPSCTYFDMEMPGGSAEANRFFFKIQPVPLAGQTDARYSLQRFIPWLRKSRISVRGAAQ